MALTKERLDEVVAHLKEALAKPEMRVLSQRAVQGKVWHLQPSVSAVLMDLRGDEERIRRAIMTAVSKLVYQFHEHAMVVTLARAGILQDDRVHAGTSLHKTTQADFDLFCLDAKERLYVMLKQYGWLEEFFRLFPQHFYENSFSFVGNIPSKKLQVTVKVYGLGIGGSMALSGLAKAGIEHVQGFDKRQETGPSSISSRYQNASWRAYDIAQKLLDDEAYQQLVEYRQRIDVTYDDGTKGVITSDRVQIILGSAIESALGSAKRYGANIQFGHDAAAHWNSSSNNNNNNEGSSVSSNTDIVALFLGAHTADLIPGLNEQMEILSWPELKSDCKMWLRIKESDKTEFYCTRGGEIGAEKWNYTIESARNTLEDIVRVRNCLVSQYENSIRNAPTKEEQEQLTKNYQAQRQQLDRVQEAVEQGKTPGGRFDYIFTNAPINAHNLAKREAVAVDGSIVLDGGYTVDVKIASNSCFHSTRVNELLKTDLIACGGDACVPPNPLAAYGTTLACESADMLVQLAVGYGHLNPILNHMESDMKAFVNEGWVQQVKDLKLLLAQYYNARGKSENYFQWVQTLICNLYSLPPLA